MNVHHPGVVGVVAGDGDRLGFVPVLIPALPECLCAVVWTNGERGAMKRLHIHMIIAVFNVKILCQ